MTPCDKVGDSQNLKEHVWAGRVVQCWSTDGPSMSAAWLEPNTERRKYIVQRQTYTYLIYVCIHTYVHTHIFMWWWLSSQGGLGNEADPWSRRQSHDATQLKSPLCSLRPQEERLQHAWGVCKLSVRWRPRDAKFWQLSTLDLPMKN